jgi:hypothetical protein
LKRWELRTPYTSIVADVVRLMTGNVLGGPAKLIIDATGVGRAVVDMFRAALPRHYNHGALIAVTITGGASEGFDSGSGNYSCPKKNLVAVLQSFFGAKCLRIAQTLPLAAALRREMENFSIKTTELGGTTFEAWRAKEHDDLVLATSLACWSARCSPRPNYEAPVTLLTPGRTVDRLAVGGESDGTYLEW